MENQTFQYMMLNRLQSDCEYFLNFGRGSLNRLHYPSIEEHIDEMLKLWNNLIVKPEWLSLEQIKVYEQRMLSYEQ